MNEAQRAIQSWNYEVERELARLIESGVPPYDAADKARQIVSERRQQKHAQRSKDVRHLLSED